MALLPRVTVLRIGHRPARDTRVTTHVGLTARAFGAERMLLAGEDPGVLKSIREVARRWGGDFGVEDGISWRRAILDWKAGKGAVVHLTMYGTAVERVIERIRSHERIMVVVGAEKVPGELYALADYNVSVTTQPHSEISALAVFLDRLFMGREMELEYPEAEMRIDAPLKGEGEE